ncbi:MAG: pseudouridine synthase [Bacteroidia bacterium]|nr:pseudouridine synthase [Bacteroidia bacterium]
MAQRINKSKSPKGKGTSFGKKSSAEKAFRGKKKPRTDDSFGDERKSPTSSYSKPFRGGPTKGSRTGGFSKPRDERGAGDFKKPFRREGGEEKPFRKSAGSSSFGRPGGFSKPDFKRPYNKGDEGSSDAEGGKPRFSKPFRREGGEEKPFRKSAGSSSFGRPGGFSKPDFKRPYNKRDEGSSDTDSDKPRFSKPFRSEGGDEKPFRKSTGSSSFGRPGGFSKPDFKRPYNKRDEGSSDAEGGKPKFSKPFQSEGGDEKPFRKTESSSPSFSKERSFGKTEGDFKKRGEDSSDSRSEKPKRFEKKPFGDSELRPFVKKRIVRSGKSFKPKVWEDKPSDGLTRLNKYIANSGVCSRREADNLITMGLISVNKVTITELGYKVKQGDQVRYEDKLLKAEKPVYILLNKPKGFITTTDDPQERNTVMNLVASACKERIYPVGRLDRNTTGLLLLTNDGDLAEKLMHPSYKAKKIYTVELDKALTKNDFIKIQEGVHLQEGKAMVDEIAMISDDSKTVGIEIHIGWNRVVRRIFETLGYDVVRLDRSVYAGLDKKEIGRGEWRFLKPEEIVKLKHFKG